MTKVTALLSLLLLAAAASTVRSQYETINFDYDFNGETPTTLTFQGAARFLQNNPNLSLTPGSSFNEQGRVLHTAPVPIKTADRTLVSFYSTIKFFLTPYIENTQGDGIAFFIAPVGSTIPIGAVGGRFGVFNGTLQATNTVVVEFDTRYDEVWDPNYQHIGINVGTIISNNVTNMYGLLMGQEVTAEISYATPESRLTVRVLLGRAVYEVSTDYPLSTFLTDEVQFGLSASTYNRLARQDIISWHNNYTVAVSPQIREVVV